MGENSKTYDVTTHFKDLFKLIKRNIRNKVLNQMFKSYN